MLLWLMPIMVCSTSPASLYFGNGDKSICEVKASMQLTLLHPMLDAWHWGSALSHSWGLIWLIFTKIRLCQRWEEVSSPRPPGPLCWNGKNDRVFRRIQNQKLVSVALWACTMDVRGRTAVTCFALKMDTAVNLSKMLGCQNIVWSPSYKHLQYYTHMPLVWYILQFKIIRFCRLYYCLCIMCEITTDQLL